MAFAACHSAAAKPLRARRLAKPSNCEVGHKGARLHMKGKDREGGQTRKASVRRAPAGVVLAALLAYNALGCLGIAPAFSVKLQAHAELDFRREGEPVKDGSGLDNRRVSDGVAETRQPRSPRPGEMAFAACHSAAAKPVRSRTPGGNMAGCGELELETS